jgi:enediyne polyketide synthase
MNNPIAIVGLACLYPEARTPFELWENVLAQRRAFRRLPAERLRAEDYWSPDTNAADKTYAVQAAVIEGYEFDRVAFRVVGSTYRSADLAHWLALDIASQALADAGFKDGAGLPRENTGVVLGNTLTGEFSRANLMRLRWPYVRRVLAAELEAQGWAKDRCASFLESLEQKYKAPFPPVGEETLAGGLSNTIAGRICNQFDLKGGGYTVDGACASSLLAVANACSSLVAGDLDVALAGGVDLSLDPFEIIGFAKTGALAPELMRIYDARSAGFWPGEGCGFAVLMRYDDAVAEGRRIYATIRGWGISSDGTGGITRPEIDGQLQALRRAYHRAGYGIDSVEYFEGHGTGTNVGDATELRVISRARRESNAALACAAIGSIKANIGHTKAAAGIAGLIKATLAVHTQTLPPTTGCERPHPELSGDSAVLRVLREPEAWPDGKPLRASVSAMGFGGINTHVTLEAGAVERRRKITSREQALSNSAQDCELFLLDGADSDELLKQIEHLLSFAARLSFSELADLAAELSRRGFAGAVRASVVAGTPAQLAERLTLLRSWLLDGVASRQDFAAGIFLGTTSTAPRIGFLFPGQGSPTHLDGGIFRRRFETVRELYASTRLPMAGDGVSTEIAQPAIATASIAGLRALDVAGITANVAVGHSLGEITALHWAGAFDEATLLRIARERGRAMAELGGPTGSMAAIAAPAREVQPLLEASDVSIVGYNSPKQTVVAGEESAVAALVACAKALGFAATRLPVSHAFHTPLVAAATPVLAQCLACEEISAPRRRVVSTILGAPLAETENLRELLCRQVTAPVKFTDALSAVAGEVDLWIEVGPGEVLAGLARDTVASPVVSIDAGAESLRGLWRAVGAAFALGAPIDAVALFRNRFTRPFNLDWKPKFFVNPCELAPVSDATREQSDAVQEPETRNSEPETVIAAVPAKPLDLLRQLVAERAELPVSAVTSESRLLGDLHLNSISVGQLIAEAVKRLGLPPLITITDFATATIGRVATALEEIAAKGITVADESKRTPAGVDSWVRPFVFEWCASELRPNRGSTAHGVSQWKVFAPENHPLAASLRERFATAEGHGVVCLLSHNEESHVHLLLDSAKSALNDGANRFVLVQDGRGAGSFARTLHLEAPHIHTCVLDLPFGDPRAADWILSEALGVEGHTDVRYDAAGRHELVMKALPLTDGAGELPLGSEDVLLVTGGGKGIAAECALALARSSGTALVLLGRATPDVDRELAANLERIRAAGIRCRYFAADVTDVAVVGEAILEAQCEFGPITALLHAAGTNVPQPITSLDEPAFRRTLAPKIDGARNVLAALDCDRLRLFITFGSIIGRAGLQGEADYAVANEWLTNLTEDFQKAHTHCRCLAAEWSVWSGVGMGARLGRIESLRQQGITPISPEAGVRILEQLLRQRDCPTSVVIAGRFGELPTLKLAKPELPFRRFLEQPRVFYPGVELVADSTLSADSDPYVEEHVFHGEPLFPAVMGLEAMAQVAMALAGSQEPPSFDDVELARPVVVPRGGKNVIRVAALIREPGVIDVVLRCEQTGFQADHFRATCRFDGCPQFLEGVPTLQSQSSTFSSSRIELDPAHDLYDRLLFHTGRFRRVMNYRVLRAKECAVQLAPLLNASWFGRYLPQERVLGCGAVRDAAIHAIQACIPHARLLPVGIRRIVVGAVPCRMDQWKASDCLPELILHAREVKREGDTFEYDLQLLADGGVVLEKWEGLRLRKVEELPVNSVWPDALFGPYIERRLEELIPHANVSLSFSRNGHSEKVVQQLLGNDVTLHHRSDGKPEVRGAEISVARAGNITLTASSDAPIGCDIESISNRSIESWRDLLGAERFHLAQLIARHEDLDTAATRVWTAMECLKKAGVMSSAPLVLGDFQRDGWVMLRSGDRALATCAAEVTGAGARVVVGVFAAADPS